MDFHGIHHVTAVSADIGNNVDFYTRMLGLRLVKKSVNQDDTSAYHLFYADKVGSPGTDMTFFDWHTPPERRGTDSIINTAFRVASESSLQFWADRLESEGIQHQGIETFNNRRILRFEDPEGQRLTLVEDGGVPYEGEIWERPDIPQEHTLRGFYAVTLSIPKLEWIAPILTQLLSFQASEPIQHPSGQSMIVFSMDGGGAGREVWVTVEPNKEIARQGAGAVHHVAFRVRDKDEQTQWLDHLTRAGMPTSGFVDRFYFNSVYFRISNGILFEIATDGPGFDADEDIATLGEKLALPPFLEPRRQQIEARLKPIVVPD